jgi:hypothetical protein
MHVSFELTNAFHVGVRVHDLEAAMAEMEKAFGISWASLQERDQRLWTADGGAVRTPLRFTYSKEGPMHIELLQGQVGTIWDAGQGPGLHHTGVWSDDVRGETEAYLESGWALIAAQLGPEDGYGTMTYVESPTGFVLELVDSAVRPRFETWWAGGELG